MVEQDTQTKPNVMPRTSTSKSHDIKPRTFSDEDDDVAARKHRRSKSDKHRHKRSQETESPSRKNLPQNLTFNCEKLSNFDYSFITVMLLFWRQEGHLSGL